MSIVSPPPLTHQPFSESDIYPSSPSSSTSKSRDLLTPLTNERTLVPFPIFQHRHSSPFPTAHSFSALGPAPTTSPPKPTVVLGTLPPPPAPKPPPMNLPKVVPDGTDLFVNTTLPPTPDPSPPNSKVLFPDAMIRLAPPADEDFDIGISRLEDMIERVSDDIPRCLPLVAVDQLISVPLLSEPNMRKTPSVHGPPAHGPSAIATRPRSRGPSGHPMRRSQTAIHPSSIRMADSQGADPRAWVKSSLTSPRNTSGPLLAPNQRTSSPGLPRSLTTPAHDSPSIPRAGPIESSASDMGGPDGLEAKVVLLGSQNAGKTSLILRYTTRTFSPTPAAATIGSSLHARKLIHDGIRVKLQIWDTAGQERFRSMAPIYYRGAHVCVLVYDVTDRRSFEDVRSWLEELGRTVPKETVIYIVGSKIDLVTQRVISPEEAHAAIRSWIRPLTPPRPQLTVSPPSSRNLLRSPSLASRAEPHTGTTSILTSPTPTRSHSHTALTTLNHGVSVPLPGPPVAKSSEAGHAKTGTKPFPVLPSTKPALQITAIRPDPEVATSPRSRKLSFQALHSPTQPTSVTFTEPIKPSLTPASPTSRHGVSGGRFSISGVLGYSRSPSMGGAMSNLSRLAENNPTSPRQAKVSMQPTTRAHSFGSEGSIPRARTESSPMLDNRRKSEDWSSRSWRMGEGPGAAEALGEFGAGIKKKQSGELLGSNLKNATVPLAGPFKKGRARGGSLGRDSRLYRDEPEEEMGWGIEIENMRVGEVSAATGQGVEALFKSISALLVQKRENIERERTLRRKDSVMLSDQAALAKDAKSKSKGCCAW